MADRYENDLVTREDVDDINVDTDYIRTLDENGVSYKDEMAKIAKAFLEDYDETALAGSPRTVKTAFSALADGIAGNADAIAARTCTANEWETLLERLNTYK